MSAALALAGMGHRVELVEREGELGGEWRSIRSQADGSDPQAALEAMVARVRGAERIRVRLGSEVVRLEGKAGRYRSVVRSRAGEEEVEHGALVVATGGGPAGTKEYLYGQDPRVLTQRELEAQLAEGTLAQARNVVMIQCVGSREAGRPYCSRVCCTQAVKNALQLKAERPEVGVYVLYREVRTYGFRERYYEAAREAGVVFVRYEVEEKPEVEARPEGLRVRVQEPVLGEVLEIEAELVVLSVGIEAAEGGVLAGVLGLELNGDGFYQEEHGKMKPLDLGREGMYVAGLAHSPRFLAEAVAQGQGAAMRAAAYLGLEVRESESSVWVNERLCSYCGLCVAACPYGARELDGEARVARVDYELCKGCGVCAVVCPNKATLQQTFEHGQLLAALDLALV
jgi:heterodisulfide reductase subunit A